MTCRNGSHYECGKCAYAATCDERMTIHGEICRVCGWSNVMFDYEIDLRKNKVRYRVDCYIHGSACSWERFFDDYQEAAQEFGFCEKMANDANRKERMK